MDVLGNGTSNVEGAREERRETARRHDSGWHIRFASDCVSRDCETRSKKDTIAEKGGLNDATREVIALCCGVRFPREPRVILRS